MKSKKKKKDLTVEIWWNSKNNETRKILAIKYFGNKNINRKEIFEIFRGETG